MTSDDTQNGDGGSGMSVEGDGANGGSANSNSNNANGNSSNGGGGGGDNNTDDPHAQQQVQPPPQNREHLNLKVKAQDGTEVYFKVKKTTKLKKLMDAYCARVGKEAGSIRFLFDGDRIAPESTPHQLGMEDEDEIDAMVEVKHFCVT